MHMLSRKSDIRTAILFNPTPTLTSPGLVESDSQRQDQGEQRIYFRFSVFGFQPLVHLLSRVRCLARPDMFPSRYLRN